MHGLSYYQLFTYPKNCNISDKRVMGIKCMFHLSLPCLFHTLFFQVNNWQVKHELLLIYITKHASVFM